MPFEGVVLKFRDVRMDSKELLDLSDLGFGMTHLLSVVTCLLRKSGSVVAVQQPEAHVHPALQAELGELFARAWEQKRTRSIIETHSEHIIRRLQRLVRNHVVKPQDVVVIYVDRTPDGSTVTPLRMDAAGDFIDNWPGGFFPEGLNETLG
jgi:predicted ATPase